MRPSWNMLRRPDWKMTEGMTRTPNTDAHRLIYWAGIEGKQSQAVMLCLTPISAGPRYWQSRGSGRYRGWHRYGCLAVLRLLASDADREDIRNRDAHSREMGINSVPTFIVAQQHAVPGAQPPELASVIEELRAQVQA